MYGSTTNQPHCRNDQIPTVPWRTEGVEDVLAKNFRTLLLRMMGCLHQALGKYPKSVTRDVSGKSIASTIKLSSFHDSSRSLIIRIFFFFFEHSHDTQTLDAPFHVRFSMIVGLGWAGLML